MSRRRARDVNPRTLIVELFLALEKAGVSNPVSRTRQIARSLHVRFSNADATRWLEPFVRKNPTSELRSGDGKLRGRSPSDRNSCPNGPIEKRTDHGTENASCGGPTLTLNRTEDVPLLGPIAGLARIKGTPGYILRETTSLSQGALGDDEPKAFVACFLGRGIDLGAIPRHVHAGRYLRKYRRLLSTLFAHYGVEECRVRADRMLRLKVASFDPLRAEASIATLHDHWSLFEADRAAEIDRAFGRPDDVVIERTEVVS